MNPYGNLREASNDPLKVLNPTPLKEPCKRSLKGTLQGSKGVHGALGESLPHRPHPEGADSGQPPEFEEAESLGLSGLGLRVLVV